MINRTGKYLSPEVALTRDEIGILEKIVQDGATRSSKTLAKYLTTIAQLGGYLARANDPPPGNMVIWRGLARLIDIQIGYLLAMEVVGN